MAQTMGPRSGSMQFWPRVRAKTLVPRVRTRFLIDKSPIDGFYGYKVGMTHAMFKDVYANSPNKNQTVMRPLTILECPPMKVIGVRLYKTSSTILSVADIYADKLDKDLNRALNVPKAKEFDKELANAQYDFIRLIVSSMPKGTGIGKKKPEIFEIALSGDKAKQTAFAKEKFGKEITVTETLGVNQFVDIHAVTTGRGFQGPVKRFGVRIRRHKSEKVIRGPGSLGAWQAQQKFMYRVAHAGQTGYHLRTEMNKPIIYIGADLEKINPKGGFLGYGNVKSTYMLLLGSIPGPKKRIVRLTHPIRASKKSMRPDKLQLLFISQESQQKA